MLDGGIPRAICKVGGQEEDPINYRCHSASLENRANVRLIAAAPELLSELIAYHDREWREDHEGIPAHHAGDFPDECGACAVIVKATGGE